MNKGSEFYWSKYHDQQYIEQHRNKNGEYSVYKGGHYGIKSLWDYAKNNVPTEQRMPFIVYALQWTKGSYDEAVDRVKEKFYELDTHSDIIAWKYGRIIRPSHDTLLHYSYRIKPKYLR
ncbi:MAG: hypothetical protein CMJ25_16700 [Phycisphaerae bacterium]|nr:hypothetical protein [Phycisphaerae bacterium]